MADAAKGMRARPLSPHLQVWRWHVTMAGSIPGKIVFFFITLSVFYHLANGLRHLAWDAGYGFNPKTADLTGIAAMAFAIVAAAAVWFLAAMTGAL
jgi:succinate dehydrogenase / fumarate reductase cytochrome b subunit